MPYVLENSPWPEGTGIPDRYLIGEICEWNHDLKRIPDEEREPVLPGQFRYATKCIGRIEGVCGFTFALVRTEMTNIDSPTSGPWVSYSLEPVIVEETGEVVPDMETGHRAGKGIEIRDGEPVLTEGVQFEYRHIDFEVLLADVRSVIFDDLVEPGNALFRYRLAE